MIGGGQLNRRIEIKRPVVTYNDFNEPIETLTTLATIWANKQDVSASEAYRAQEVGAQITTRFTIRYSDDVADVNPVDSIAFRGGAYNIVAVREMKRNRFIEIDAVRRPEIAAAEAGSP